MFVLSLDSKVLWDLMSTAGTAGTAKVLLDICIQDNMRHAHFWRCKEAITTIGLFAPPSEMIINRMMVS